MPLSDGMKNTLLSVGYTEATPIQEKAIPELLAGRDLLGQAQTGTGKTAAFGVPLLEMLDDKSESILALVLCPTRELCLQVCGELQKLAAHKQKLKVAALYGGQAIDQQFKTLKRDKPQVIVATPGRLFDHVRRKTVSLGDIRMIVLDEADEMLDMGFRPQIEEVLGLLPEENQRIFFSATMPKLIMDLACSFLRDPVIIRVQSKDLTAEKVRQSYVRVSPRDKSEVLCRMLDFYDPKLAVVFCNAKATIDQVVDDIQVRGFNSAALHGDLSQAQRDRVMSGFRQGHIKVLVATDIAARGIDVDDVELVFNYHLPHDPEDYVHRIGRTGRAGRVGQAISLVDPKDNSRLRKISHFANSKISERDTPTFSDVKAAKLTGIFTKVKTALAAGNISEYKSFISKHDMSMDDFAAGLLQVTLAEFDKQAQHDYKFDSREDKRYSSYAPNGRDRDRKEGGGRFFEKRGREKPRFPSRRPEGARPFGARSDGPRSDAGRPDSRRSEGGRPDFRRSEGGARPDFRRAEGGRPDFRRSSEGGRPDARRAEGGRSDFRRPSEGGRPDSRRSDKARAR